MKQKLVARIFLVGLSPFIILWILLNASKRPNDRDNGFTRKWISEEAPIIQEGTINSPVTTIWGKSSSSFYITGPNPRSILILNKDLVHKDTMYINFNAPDDKIVPFALFIDTPNLYLHLNNLKKLIFGGFPDQKLTSAEIKSEIFTKSIQISPKSLIIRAFKFSERKQVFQKIDCESGRVLKEAEIISDQGHDSGIQSDGMMAYEPYSNRFFYVEYLRNKFYCIDTNLNNIYTKNTIDTTQHNSTSTGFQVAKNGEGKLTSTAARIVVNKSSIIDSKYLYIISGLKADNERSKDFGQNTVIDKYRLSDGKYTGSFYIKKLDFKSFKSATISHDTLTVLYDHAIISYRLPNDMY